MDFGEETYSHRSGEKRRESNGKPKGGSTSRRRLSMGELFMVGIRLRFGVALKLLKLSTTQHAEYDEKGEFV